MREMGRDGTLGHLVPPGKLDARAIRTALFAALDRQRFLAGIGIPSAPTRFVVAMHPSDRVWLPPATEDDCARVLAARAEASRMLMVGPIEVRFEVDPARPLGDPAVWVGFAETDLLVLADPSAAAEVFAEPSHA